ncbi:MAG: YdcF family protein [Chitinophagaceae bacterium]|nr:MAG: YdcF family protein [Chitinophagaceae bacterium]
MRLQNMRMRKLHTLTLLILLNLLLVASLNAVAQSNPSLRIVSSKNYYFLSLLDSANSDLQDLLSKDAILQQMARVKADSLAANIKTCERQRACVVDLMQFSEAEITQVGERIQALWKKGNELDLLLTKKLVPSRAYSFSEEQKPAIGNAMQTSGTAQQPGTTSTARTTQPVLTSQMAVTHEGSPSIQISQISPAEFLRKAWEQDARGINYAIQVYGNARRPNYPNIDSVDFKVRDPKDTSLLHPSFFQLLYNSAYILDQRFQRKKSFYSVPLEFALLMLDVNERNQAADYEPMELGINKAPVKAIKSTNWSKYPYTVIVVPGAGPDEYGINISAEAKLRCRLAAEYYRQGKAPFLIVTGGKVHPYKTTVNEAVEMKKYMMEQLSIPESAIIAEPHARHTTTNMRNAARLMFKYNIPTDRPGLVSTTRGQSSMIANTLAERCRREIGYTPFRAGKVLSESLTEFFALKEAFRIDPEEPMDP